MLILSRVCAEFRDRSGTVIYRVTPDTRLTFREAPEAIREDPLFELLIREGSLEAAITPVQQKQLENAPLEGADAAGRKPAAASSRNSGRKARTKEAPEADIKPAEEAPDCLPEA